MPDTNGVKTIEHAQGNGPNDHKEAEEHDVLLEKERKKSEKEEDEERIEGSPMDRAFFFSKYVSFWWMNALFAKGSKKSLEEGDLDDPPKADKADGLCEKLERNWQLEAYGRDGNFKSKPSLIKVFWKTFGAQYILLGLFALVTEALRIAQPVLLGKLVAYFSTGSKVTTMEAYLYAMGMTLCSLGITLHIIPFQFLRQKIGMQARIGTCGLVYKKVLNLSNAALASTTTGYIVNLVSSDAQKLDFAAMFLHYLWLGPIEVIVMAYLLYQELGWPSFVGIGVLLLLGPAQMAMGRLLMAFRRKIMKWTDQRIKIMNEVIAGMRVIKLYTWEKSFAKLVANIRAHEMKAIAKLCYLRACFMSFFFSSGSLISFVTFITYALSGNILTSAKVFTSMALFNTAKLVMTLYLPIGITFFNEARVACERIQRFLTMEDITKPGEEKSNFRPKSSDCGVFIENLTAAWTEDQSTLEDISLTAKEAELVAVVGPVGCGKSSLLMAVLGELPAKEGKVDVKGKIAYASQQAWVFNGTLRYNVTFGQEFDEDRYREVLKVCALERDIELLAEGDMTLVGERGVSLSGGQRARVNLARAVYADADIYIMDDPLSAVDAHVGRHLFDQCINGYLAKKPRILVTHQLQYLTDADNIIALSNGKCIGQGTFYELTDMGIDFMTLLTEEDNVESGIEIDIEEAEDRQRRFSKQESCALIPREKAGSFLRQESRFRRRASSFLRQESRIRDSSIMSSEFGIAEHAEQVEVIDDEGVLPKEKKAEGAIGYSVYLDFFKAGYGLVVWGFVALLFAICQAVYLLADYWLSYWTSKEEKYYYSKRTAKDLEKVNRKRDLLIYSVLVVSLVVLGLTRAFVFFKVILKASQSLHGKMFGSLLRAPVYFFDTNSIESLNGSGITALKFCPSNRNGQLQLPQACLTLNRLGGRICLQDGSFLCCAETGDLATETNEDNDFTTAIHIVIILCFIGHLCYPQGPAEMFGRILNRFSKDMSLVDDMLSFTFFDFVQTLLVVTGILILVGSAQPIVFAVVVPLVIVFFLLRRYYIRTAREVKRLEGTTRSPVFGHFSTTLLGLPTIRAFGVQPQFTDMFFDYQDGHTKAWFAFLGCGNWLGFRLELLCLTFVAFVSFVSVAIFGACKNVKSKTARPRARATTSAISAGAMGLVLTYTINITGVFQQCVRQSTEVENNMTSVERIVEYCKLEAEPPEKTDVEPPKEWPDRGSIYFKDMSFRYAAALPNVLHHITCKIHRKEKIGVCGRTGAGKSSLLSTLFRTAETSGTILIDDIDIGKLGLFDLRSKISIIPQDPVIFSGTMRHNLDPFDSYSDLEVWNALEEVQLKAVVQAMPDKLETDLAESGSNLSVGQRQLVCLARAILRRNKILVIDKATANVDPITDALIQTTIREKFKDCTVLTIAHRLNTIMDSDRIMVLDAGKLKELAEPYALLRCKNTMLYKLVGQTGPVEAQQLFDIARKTHFRKRKKPEPPALDASEEMGALDEVPADDDSPAEEAKQHAPDTTEVKPTDASKSPAIVEINVEPPSPMEKDATDSPADVETSAEPSEETKARDPSDLGKDEQKEEASAPSHSGVKDTDEGIGGPTEIESTPVVDSKDPVQDPVEGTPDVEFKGTDQGTVDGESTL